MISAKEFFEQRKGKSTGRGLGLILKRVSRVKPEPKDRIEKRIVKKKASG